MIKLIVFDLDGVLLDAKEIHYNSLNIALAEVSEEYVINENEHLNIYDGLKTNQKLDLLTKNKGLPREFHKQIWNRKQELTLQMLESVERNQQLIDTFVKLSANGYKLACCSNSIRKSVFTMLSKIGIIEYFDLIISNEDVLNSKPHPEMYWSAMSKLNFMPEDTLIVEDSPHGLLAAHRAKANIFRVNNSHDVTYSNIINQINKFNSQMSTNIVPKWEQKNVNVLIPMAGRGSRFAEAGYVFPKPLIEVNGKPMIEVVVNNLNIKANFIYIVQQEHRDKYNLDTLLNMLTPGCTIISVDGITEGAACTTLLAKELINNDEPLLFANSDQFVEWNSSDFYYFVNNTAIDGCIMTFKATHPKWSFAKVDENNFVTEVAEKNPISDNATTGIYWWAKGSDYVKYAEQMIAKNIRVNNEFYVCPVYNQAIEDGKKVKVYEISKMWGIGTPEDLNYYLQNYKA